MKVRSDLSIALAVVSSRITATLLAHTDFKLPLNLIHSEIPVCSISEQSNMGQVLWDYKHYLGWEHHVAQGCSEALIITFKDIRWGVIK